MTFIPDDLALALPVVLPFTMAALALLFRSNVIQRTISLGTLAVLIANAINVLIRVDKDGTIVSQAGDWAAPFGITLLADRTAALLVLVSELMLFIVLLYAVGQGLADDRDNKSHVRVRYVFHPVYLVLASGVAFAFLTGDLFNLFVAFEVMLTASYVLITLEAGPRGVRSGMTYIVVSLLASMLFIFTLGVVYASTGTVNMADLVGRLDALPRGLQIAIALLMIVVFGIKAALFPLFFWLPDSYPVAPAPVTAVFAGLLTKVGVYTILRTQTLLFNDISDVVGPVLLTMAGLTLVMGIMGSISQIEMKRVLSFTIVSHIGFMVMGIGFFTLSGIAGAVFYIVHHIVIQTTLFCVEGLVERRTGTSRMDQISGVAHMSPLIAGLFALPALSLSGFPPFSGFVGKVALVRAGVQDHNWAMVGVAIVVSVLTVVAIARVWSLVFWGKRSIPFPDDNEDDALDVGTGDTPKLMVAATVLVVIVGLAIPLAGGPLYDLCQRAALDLLNPSLYVNVVLGKQS